MLLSTEISKKLMLITKLYINDKIVGTVEIVNITRNCTRISSDYYWRVKVKPLNKPEYTRMGLIIDSYNGDAMQCLQEVLDNWRRKIDYAVDNHGDKTYKSQSMALTPAEYWEKYDKYNKSVK